MRNNSTHSTTLSLSAVLATSLLAGCVVDEAPPAEEDDGLEEAELASGAALTSVTPLPSFASTPNIRQAVGQLSKPTAVAVVETAAGFQIYRCEQGAAGPEWKLRTPLAVLAPSPNVQREQLNRSRLASLAASYHYRSDFGALLPSDRIEALGLAQPPTNAPVWDFTFQPSGAPVHREILAGRLVAQDVTNAANIPALLLEVRGRSIDAGPARVLASATHVLRWNTRGGLAPAASSCTAGTLGREMQSPYSTDYYFLKTTP